MPALSKGYRIDDRLQVFCLDFKVVRTGQSKSVFIFIYYFYFLVFRNLKNHAAAKQSSGKHGRTNWCSQ